jgi:hypothetical protein
MSDYCESYEDDYEATSWEDEEFDESEGEGEDEFEDA